VRTDQWLGGGKTADPGEARREVLRRYLHAYGPAKPADFRRWSGFDREPFAELDLEPVRVEGTRSWLLRDDLDGFDGEPRAIRLLPRYDAYVIGFRPREPILPAIVNDRVAQDPKGRFESVTGMAPLVVDGVVSGFWRRSGRGITVERVLALPRGRRRELDAAVDRVQAALS
jgi:hypothetical protein